VNFPHFFSERRQASHVRRRGKTATQRRRLGARTSTCTDEPRCGDDRRDFSATATLEETKEELRQQMPSLNVKHLRL